MSTFSDRGIDWGESSQQSEALDIARSVSENRQRLTTTRVLIYKGDDGENLTITKVCTPNEMVDVMDSRGIDRHTVHAKGAYDPIMDKWEVSGPSLELQQVILGMPLPKQK